ncbi:hypothetical protein PC129_g17445 [Phytophthora cactorum]|uniref:Ankyrin repeat-containing domain n=1 Tax=Phytophthora cactorum TaxID=29920 RepID=A0A8T1HHX2_9STRA|nr:hypothetical protein PC112_g15765 [Phytophthora cactorum]KAG2812415.1 hypothetical protein PC111_g14825 [Phytophthora cactorum]KAG2890562.1 hypothetical protein PC114_g17404 [Phytophthora cactorum]KAG2919512.1 hypothetical protein PC117_g16758 [Phytophthora cactorum]KAG2991110.1 hypothetical protein PC119_g18980 [Phytophthora cactorum]
MALRILRRFLVLLKEFPRCEKNVLRFASKKGRGDVVRWLVKLFPDTKRSLLYAAEGGHLNLLKWLTKHTSWNEASIRGAFRSAIEEDHLDIAKFLYDLTPARLEIKLNLRLKSLEMMQWIHDTKCWDFAASTASALVVYTASAGKLEMMQWLYMPYPELFSKDFMGFAAEREL